MRLSDFYVLNKAGLIPAMIIRNRTTVTKRIRLTIAYDGTDYAGFQVQPGLRTIEGELNRALTELTGTDITVIGASRTDSGVHALGNAAVFDYDGPIPPDRFAPAMLPYLPDDIRIVRSEEVPADWHPRHVSCIKTYCYTYSFGPVENPLTRRYQSYLRRKPDVRAMQEAAKYLIGEHDFTSFANPSSQVLLAGGSAVRTVTDIRVSEERSGGLSGTLTPEAGTCSSEVLSSEAEDAPAGGAAGAEIPVSIGTDCVTVRIYVSGTGFLYNMVRIIAGTLMQAGTGLWTPERVREALEAKDRTKAGPTAEARGLTLIGIHYHES